MSFSKTTALGILILASISLPAVAQDKPKPAALPRLALVSIERSDAMLNLLNLAEVQLSKNAQIELVERRALEKLLAEQKLSLAGFVKHDQILKVGKLLGVDLFAIVETDEAKKQAVGLVIFDAGTGVRLWDAALPGDGIEPAADGVAQAVRAAHDKFRKFDGAQRTVCLTTIRNVDFPRDKDAFCDTVGVFLERGLVSSPSLALLERTRLDQVNKERDLPTDSPVKQLLASLIRLEIDVARSADGKGLKATALVFDSQGKLLGKPSVEVARQDAVELAQALLLRVAGTIKTKPGSVVQDRVKEAQRFGEEAEFFNRHADLSRELRAREASVALNPNDFKQRRGLAVALQRMAFSHVSPYRIGPKYPSEVEVRRCLESLPRALAEQMEVEAIWYRTPAIHTPHVPSIDLMSFFTIDKKKMVRAHTPETRGLFKSIEDLNVRMVDARFEHAFAAVTDKESFQKLVVRMAHNYELALDTPRGLAPDQQKKHVQKQLTRWLDLAERYGAAPLPAKSIEAIYLVLKTAAGEPTVADRVQKYRAKLRTSPVFQVYDAMLECQLDVERANRTPIQRQERLREFRLLVEKMIVAGQESPELRIAGYHTFATILRHDPDFKVMDYAHPVAKEAGKLCDFMIAQKDFAPGTAMDLAVGLARKPTRDNEQQSLAYVKALTVLLDSPQCRYLPADQSIIAGSPEFQKLVVKQMLSVRQKHILSRYPDLDGPRVEVLANMREILDVQSAQGGGIVRLAQPRVHEGALYVLALGQTPRAPSQYIQLLRFSLPEGKRTLLGKVAVDTGYEPPTEQQLALRAGQPNGGDNFPFAVDACIDNGRYFVATRDKGIFIFPLDGKEVEVLNTDAGLPTNFARRISVLDDKLYASLGEPFKEAYLVALDLKNKQVNLLASSRRKDVQSPFDDSPPWTIRAIMADPKRQRVLFCIDISRIELIGLWEIDAKTQRLKQLEKMKSHYWHSPLRDDKLLLATFDATTLFDFATGKKTALPYYVLNGKEPHIESRIKDVTSLLNPGKSSRQLCPGHFLHDGWLWSASTFGRVSLDGQTRETFLSPRRKSTLVFHPNECFEMHGNLVILADLHGLWFAEVAPRK